jgi:hypothetical protein
VEILRVDVFEVILLDFAELEHNENMTEFHLNWLMGPSVEEALPILKRCTNLRRLTLSRWKKRSFPPIEELRDFIMELKHLTYLHIKYSDNYNCDHSVQSLVGEANEFVLPRRPNFKFYISCCEMFASQIDESRIEVRKRID